MKECKPCIEIRTILKLLWKNYVVEATERFRYDYRSSKMIGAVVCILPKMGTQPLRDPHPVIEKIQKTAKERYDPKNNPLQYNDTL